MQSTLNCQINTMWINSAAANEDFELVTAVINLSPQDFSEGFVLSIRNDTILENNETFLLTLDISEPIIIIDQPSVEIEIVDDDGNYPSHAVTISLYNNSLHLLSMCTVMGGRLVWAIANCYTSD